MKAYCTAHDLVLDDKLRTAANESFRKALIQEAIGLLVLAISAHKANKIKLRSVLTTNLKFMKNQMSEILVPDELQQLDVMTMLPSTLVNRVTQGLKLK